MRIPPAETPKFLGLNTAEVTARQTVEGYNELPRAPRRTPLRIIVEVLREPMLALLLGGGAIYLALGDLKEALMLLAFATLSIVITVIQETRTERVLEALRDLTSPRALVIRDGIRQRIAGRSVVRGDCIVLAEGDRVPADAVLMQAQNLQSDESLLTGESIPVRKVVANDIDMAAPQRPGGDDLAVVFAGSLIVSGSGLAEVSAIGPRSEIGKIGQSLSTLETEPPHLQLQIRRLIQIFGVVGGVVSLLAVVLYGTLRGSWVDAILAGIALGMSMLPEEFPVVLTVFMAMGAWRISQARVLTRRAAAIETLGAATVLCTDKTGTLTENRMSIVELRLKHGVCLRPLIDKSAQATLPEEFHDLVEFGILASAREPFDPMEKAFHELGSKLLANTQHLHGTDWTLVHSYGLHRDLLAMSQIWQAPDDRSEWVIAAKGAPEAIADLCHLDAVTTAALAESADAMAKAGLRVLGVARAFTTQQPWPDSQHDFTFELLGLVGLADPLRASVPMAVSECQSAGIKVAMITGDYPATAQAIAIQAGLGAEHVLSGRELERLTDAELAQRITTTTVFSRIMPEQKLRIVNAFKAQGEIVAMTGDGVNDAPSLKAAHIGIAMGGRGTDVAREAASIVLLDDDFGSIVRAIRLGRRIYDNLRKAMGFIFAVHVPIAGLALLPLLFNLPILYGPMHIALLEMVIDPVCSLVFEAETEEDALMRRPPRAVEAPLFSGRLIGWSVLQGTIVFAAVTAIFITAIARGMPVAEIRALTFCSLVLAIVGLIFVNRSFGASLAQALRRRNRVLAAVLAGVVVMLVLALQWSFARELLHFGPLHAIDVAMAFGAGVMVLILLEMLKWIYECWWLRGLSHVAQMNSPGN